MAKPDFKEILLTKGDKIALGIGGVLVGLLGLWGIASLATAESPKRKSQEFEQKATALRSQVNAPGQDAPELPSWVTKSLDTTKINSANFELVSSPFEPVNYPNQLRKNPPVLAIDAYQYEVLRLPIRALDIQRTTGEEALVGVKATVKVSEKDLAKLRENVKDAKNRFQGSKQPPKRPNPNAPQGGGIPGGGFPGGGFPGGGFPGGGEGGGFPGGYPGEGGGEGSFYSGGQRADQTVIYVPFTEVEKQRYALAETVYPLRAVLITASFPIKQQLEEIRKALRAQSDAEAAYLSANPLNGVPGPTFDGFDVERRILPPFGTWSEWGTLDHLTRYFQEIYARQIPGVANTPDSEYLNYFLRPQDEKLFAPLPPLADKLGDYGKLRLPGILEGVRKLKELNKPIVTQSEWEKRFGSAPGTTNPYSSGSGTSTTGFGPGGLSGEGGPGGGFPGGPGGGFPGGPGGGFPGGPGGGFPGGPGTPSGTFDPNQNPYEITTHTLIRFFDVDVQPGFSYQYRIRMRMRNPNFKQVDKVSKPEDAKVEFLEGPWQEIPDQIVIPIDSYLYAGNAGKYVEDKTNFVKENGNEIALKRLLEIDEVANGRRAVVQLQRWMPQVRIEGSGNKAEPVGAWVVADVPVAPGEFIGKRMLLQLPLWSGGLGNYVLRELTGGVKVFGIRDQKNQPKGWPVNMKQSAVLIDFNGGKVKQRIGGREVEDECAADLLILRADGKVLVRNSERDNKLIERKEREIIWNEWIERVKNRRDVLNSSQPGGGEPGGFERGGGS